MIRDSELVYNDIVGIGTAMGGWAPHNQWGTASHGGQQGHARAESEAHTGTTTPRGITKNLG